MVMAGKFEPATTVKGKGAGEKTSWEGWPVTVTTALGAPASAELPAMSYAELARMVIPIVPLTPLQPERVTVRVVVPEPATVIALQLAPPVLLGVINALLSVMPSAPV